MLKTIKNIFLDFVFPEFCCNCGRIGTLLCPSCYGEIDFLSLPPTLTTKPSYLDASLCMANYSGVIKKLITTCKYEGVKAVASSLGQLLYFCSAIPECECVTAVPLHPKKTAERRFNQAELIACELASLIKKPYYSFLLRSQHTTPQAEIRDKSERLEHQKHMFMIDELALQKTPLDGKKILLIDDVCTTGATLNECAKVLKQHGAARVVGLTVAHGN